MYSGITHATLIHPVRTSQVLRTLLLAACFAGASMAGRAAEPQSEPTDYARVATERADKIVATLGLDDPERAARVTSIVANQYIDLNAIHQDRDRRTAAVTGEDEANIEVAKQAVWNEAMTRLYTLHAAYLARLSVELTPQQVDAVKNGMTYNVLPRTWRNYQEMLPQMTPEQRRQVLAYLIEAREHAIDGSTSKEKHGWFGKYKGKITIYLAAAGYDLKKAEKAWLAGKAGQAPTQP